MPQIKTETSFSIRVTEREFKIVTQALAFLAGIAQAKPRPDDILAARELNDHLLEVQAADLNEKLKVVGAKQARAADSAEDAGNRMQ
jgi:hypothetical protein